MQLPTNLFLTNKSILIIESENEMIECDLLQKYMLARR